MRKRSQNRDISVHAIAGSRVVLLGLNATERAAEGLLGFSIFKREGRSGAFHPLGGGKIYEGVHSESDRGQIRSDKAPIQGFMWSDYVVEPNTLYTYKVIPVYGQPSDLKPKRGVQVSVTTEDPEGKTHAVFFNRGVAGSQAYSRYFGKYRRWYKVEQHGQEMVREFVRPEDVPQRKAWKWLSRGLEEAMLAFIRQADGPEYSIRAAVYELTYPPAIQAFVDALEKGVDVKILHHAKRSTAYRLKRNYDADTTVHYSEGDPPDAVFKDREVIKEDVKDDICQAADAAVMQIGLKKPEFLGAFDEMLIERTDTQISHNKFIVLLKDGKPIEVWTGSTNFTAGGIFGQSNVGHVVRDRKVAQKYFEYWQKLSTDPKKTSGKSDPKDEGIRNWNVLHQPDLTGPPPANSVTPVFSPRLSTAMLEWYADRLAAAKNSVFFTAAFSVAKEFLGKLVNKKRVSKGEPYQRYLLLETISGKMRSKYRQLSKCPQNRIAWGDTLRSRDGGDDEHGQFIETLTGLNDHVEYLHTKYMLIDPLSDDPVVITGSANFSEASTTKNDENMLIIRGNTRVADIFLGEFMRLFNHFRHRNRVNAMSAEAEEASRYLIPDDSWTAPYFDDGTQEFQERRLFA